MALESLIPGTGRNRGTAGCPACDGGERTVQFDWKSALETPDSEFKPYTRALIEKKTLKSGFLFACPNCGLGWYLDQGREKMSLIPVGKANLLEKWNSTSLSLATDLFNQCKAIGATPAHRSSPERSYAEVPCQILTPKDGWIDKCLLFFKAAPPLEDYDKPLRFSDEISGIRPSDYALPFPVRFNTCQSQSDEKGRCLTRVTSSSDSSFSLNWTVNFLDYKGIKGKDIRLDAADSKGKKDRGPVLTEPLKAITFFMADWNESVRQLLMPKR